MFKVCDDKKQGTRDEDGSKNRILDLKASEFHVKVQIYRNYHILGNEYQHSLSYSLSVNTADLKFLKRSKLIIIDQYSVISQGSAN